MAFSVTDPPTAASLDVLEIDQYLVHLLLPRFQSMFKQFGMHVPKSGMATILHAVTLWVMMADTPATLALGLKVKNNSRRRVLGYILLAVILPALYGQLVEWYGRTLMQQETDNMSPIEIRAIDRKRQLANGIIDTVKRSTPILKFVVLMSWWAAKVPAPTPSMCVAGLSYTTTSSPQDLNVSYAHRRWTYEAILQAIQLTSPIHSFRDMKALVNYILSPVLALGTRLMRQQRMDQCALCNAQPVIVPYVTNCNHLYCYTCLWTAMAQNSSFCCRHCGRHVTTSRRIQTSNML